MKFRKAGLLGTSFAAMMLMLGTSAFAQETKKEDSKVEKKEEAVKKDESVVVVTGSRIRRNEFNSTSPIQVITNEESVLKGDAETSDVIYGSTTAAGAQQVNSTWNGYVVDGGPGVNTVSLRGLGATRTLVLVNGKRMPPAGVRGTVAAVDLNTIPFSMQNRVEFLKDGASTVYGSEAVGGVVNIITNTNQKGGKIGAKAYVTQDGGGERYGVDGSYGWNFDRGNVMIGGEYYERKALTAGDRDWAQCQQEYAFNPTTGARADLIDPATGQYKCYNQLQGLVRVYSGANAGEWVPDSTSTGPIPGWKKIGTSTGGSSATPTAQILLRPFKSSKNDETTVVNPVKTTSLYASGRYQLPFGEDLEVKTDLIYNKRESEFRSLRQIFASPVTTSWLTAPSASYNPFGGYAAPVALFDFNNDQSIDTYRFNASIGGGFGDLLPAFANDWEWEIYAQTGKSHGKYGQDVIKYDEFQQAIVGCPTGSGAGCVPFNWLNANSVATGDWDAAQTKYFFAHDVGKTDYEQNIVEASINGTAFELPAGPLKFAAGLHYREESIDDQPGPITQDGNLWGSTGAGRTKGTDNVKEGFLELDIPVLAKLPLVEKLDLNLSGRQSKYKSYGSNGVYKANLNWQITPEFRFSASQGTNFRAPALYELFLANQTGFLGQTSVDPCIEWGDSTDTEIKAACSAIGLDPAYQGAYSSALIITQGSQGILKPEKADNWDIGLTWTPKSTNLRMRVDYYDITVNDTITKLNAYYIPYLCYTGRTELCSKFTRDTNPTSSEFGKITSITTGYVNIEQLTSRGIDLEADYRKEFSLGKLTVNLSGSWMLESGEEFLGEKDDYAGLIYQPSFVGDATVRFDRGDWTYTWDIDFIGKASNYAYNNEQYLANYGVENSDLVGSIYSKTTTRVKPYTEATITHGFSVRYKSDDWSVTAGVNNVFDETPPNVSMNQISGWYTRLGNSVAGGPYDLYGRTFYASFRKNF